MADPLMYQGDHYVVLETGRPEALMTAAELREKLTAVLVSRPAVGDPDLARLETVAEQVAYLLDQACELDLEPGQYLQWYVVRLEK